MVEYWAHEASFIRPDLFADLRQWQRRTWIRATSMPEEPRSQLTRAVLELLQPKASAVRPRGGVHPGRERAARHEVMGLELECYEADPVGPL